jgi:hypothetical protein
MIRVEQRVGKLKCQSDDRDAKESVYFHVSVPEHYLEMKRVDVVKNSFFNTVNQYVYGLAPFLAQKLKNDWNYNIPPMDITPYEVCSTATLAEWMVEQQGYDLTSRFTNEVDSYRDEIRDMDDEVVFILHDRHLAVKLKSPETQALLDIRFAQYRTKRNDRATVCELLAL